MLSFWLSNGATMLLITEALIATFLTSLITTWCTSWLSSVMRERAIRENVQNQYAWAIADDSDREAPASDCEQECRALYPGFWNFLAYLRCKNGCIDPANRRR